jgi:transcriptional regulator with XRE-family HTH domain
MTQVELSVASGVSQAGISRMEEGDTNLSGESLVKLCSALNVSADYLLGLSDEPRPVREGPPITLREWAILEAVRRDDLKQVMRLLGGELE